MDTSIRLLLVASLAVAAPAMADDWLFDATAGFVAYDNLGRARYQADQRSATAFELDAGAHVQPAWQTPGAVTFDVWAGLERFDRFDGFNQLRAGVGATYFDKFGLGPDAPWWSVSARAGYHDFDSSLRDGPVWQLSAALGRAFGERLDVAARATHRNQRGRSSVFDTGTAQVGVEADYRPAESIGLFAGIHWLRGDINASILQAGNVGPNWVADPTFGPGWRTYRVEADVTSLLAGATFVLGDTTQLVAGWERRDGRARRFDAPYDGDLIKVHVTHEF